jgi:putative sterol carrier protein
VFYFRNPVGHGREDDVGVKFLTDEWATATTEALAQNDAFKQAATDVKLNNVVTTPEGEKKYYFKVEGGQAEVALGELPDAEATLTQDYDTAAAIAKQELNGTAAYMSGKLKISGDLMKLMQAQGMFNAVPEAVKGIDIEY